VRSDLDSSAHRSSVAPALQSTTGVRAPGGSGVPEPRKASLVRQARLIGCRAVSRRRPKPPRGEREQPPGIRIVNEVLGRRDQTADRPDSEAVGVACACRFKRGPGLEASWAFRLTARPRRATASRRNGRVLSAASNSGSGRVRGFREVGGLGFNPSSADTGAAT
jgi:hypothetical protein